MGEQQPRVNRRTVLVTASGLALAGVGIPASMAASSDPSPPVWARGRRPISMAMHIHGSFSEGIASYAAHLDQASRTDVDVIWWTDHDFRVAAHDHRRMVHFDGAEESEGGLAWTWQASTEGRLAESAADFIESPHGADDPPRALRLSAAGDGILWYAGKAWNWTHTGNISDTTLHLDVLPESSGPDATLIIEIALSHHPARAGRPAGQYVLRYRIGAARPAGHSTDGLLGTVDRPAAPGEWRRHTLPLVEDVRRLWPDLVAGDNSLRGLRLGVGVTASARGSFVVDRLVFDRARRTGQAGEDLRAEVLRAYGDAFGGVTHHRAYEVSLVRHLNWFGGDQTLPEFPSPPYRDNDVARTERMIEFLHSHGGVVCWNHPLDVESRDSLARLMIERHNLGADLVEIGRGPLDDHLWALDVAARNAVFFTAVGVTDDHDGTDWRGRADRHITYVWASSTGRDNLVDALRAGQAWFTDLARYRGALDIEVDGRTAMGAVAVTDAAEVTVRLLATDLPAGAALEAVIGTVDLAGLADLAPATSTTRISAPQLRQGRYDLRVRPGVGAYVRTQVRSADGAILAVSNPAWFLRTPPTHGIPPARRF
ncbi:hypothetical protein GA0070624_4162 [Micromonospora rhizosphaerae]|uniref:Polymerase/histidinol phosphatase N-terminal domain-containing protein n=1 Tax=Micromonospora rhizosphaerae TaxID=568872 RepID=A0A1C6SNS2_9ACTN|nr:hypothetical protein [Micromonospora rhizosphaerae]SCL30885.1 hypothetical protein GA0070624_4162 [Micromonospora rhizosphaerae]